MAELPERLPDDQLAAIRGRFDETWIEVSRVDMQRLLAEVDRLTTALGIMSQLHIEAEQQVGRLLAERDALEDDRG